MAPSTHVEDDPIVASYTVYLTRPPSEEKPPRSILVQYPDRNARRPYGPATHQTPLAFRLKPNSGLVELDIPTDTAHNYNHSRGHAYASALNNSRILSVGGSHGLAGGFNTGQGGRTFRGEDGDVDMNTIPRHGEDEDQDLKYLTLGGKIAKATAGDPIYLLGAFQGSEIHMSHLDAVVQVRPQLHHLDAGDEIARGAVTRQSKKGEGSDKLSETRAVEIKVKSADEKNADRNRKKTNAEMLTEMQSEPWQKYNWLDTSDPNTTQVFNERMILHDGSDRTLTSALTPASYLDSISAPRIDLTDSATPHSKSALGLMGKVRGRERERRRRKKNDADRKAAAEEAARRTALAVAKGEMGKEEADEIIRLASEEVGDTSDSSEGSSDDDHAILDGDDGHDGHGSSTRVISPKRSRGRPRKNTTEIKTEPMVIE